VHKKVLILDKKENFMMNSELKNGIFVCLAVCAADGLISQEEEGSLEADFEKEFAVDSNDFQKIVEMFFASGDQLEVFLNSVNDRALRKRLLEIAARAAATDGLDISENIALQKSQAYWSQSFA
jgi:hypothetical protein